MITGNTIAIISTAQLADEAQAAAAVLRDATYRAHCFTLPSDQDDGLHAIACAASAAACDILVTLIPAATDAQCAARTFAASAREGGLDLQGWVHCTPVTLSEEDALRTVADTFPLVLASVRPGSTDPQRLADWRSVLKALGPRLLPFAQGDPAVPPSERRL